MRPQPRKLQTKNISLLESLGIVLSQYLLIEIFSHITFYAFPSHNWFPTLFMSSLMPSLTSHLCFLTAL